MIANGHKARLIACWNCCGIYYLLIEFSFEVFELKRIIQYIQYTNSARLAIRFFEHGAKHKGKRYGCNFSSERCKLLDGCASDVQALIHFRICFFNLVEYIQKIISSVF